MLRHHPMLELVCSTAVSTLVSHAFARSPMLTPSPRKARLQHVKDPDRKRAGTHPNLACSLPSVTGTPVRVPSTWRNSAVSLLNPTLFFFCDDVLGKLLNRSSVVALYHRWCLPKYLVNSKYGEFGCHFLPCIVGKITC